MTHPALTVLESETLAAATTRMVRKNLKRLPVVDQRGLLVGMLSRLDVLRQVADAPGETPAAPILPGALRTVQDVMMTDVPMVGQDDDLTTMIEHFARSDSHRLIVVDASGKALGLISDSDIVSRVQPAIRPGILDALRRIGKPPAGRETAFDLMSPGPLTGPPDLPIVEAVKKMLADSRKWLVVVDPAGKPLGLVDRARLFEAISAVYGK
jgi:CBS domain-containing protein